MDLDLLGARAVADFYGVTTQTIRNWQRRNLLPAPTAVLPSGRRLWSESALRARMKSTPPAVQHPEAQVAA